MKTMLMNKRVLLPAIFVLLITIFFIQYFIVLTVRVKSVKEVLHQNIMQASQIVLQKLPTTKVTSYEEGVFSAPAVTDNKEKTEGLFQEQFLALCMDSRLPMIKLLNTEMHFDNFDQGKASAQVKIPVEFGLTTTVIEAVDVPVPHTRITK